MFQEKYSQISMRFIFRSSQLPCSWVICKEPSTANSTHRTSIWGRFYTHVDRPQSWLSVLWRRSSWIGAWDLSKKWGQSGTITRRVKGQREGQAIKGHLILHKVLSFPQQYTLHCSNFRRHSNQHKCKCYHVYESLIYTILCYVYLLHLKPIFSIRPQFYASWFHHPRDFSGT